MMIDPGIFRAYDIRGIVGETLTEESVFLIGQAIGSFVREKGDHQVVIARDGRLSGPMLSKQLSDGLRAVGCDVVDLGMVPTPLLYFATHLLPKHAGVMLTGSHNPSNYNGLKMMVQGRSLTEAEIKNLYHRIQAKQFSETNQLGARREMQIVDRYIEAVMRDVKLDRPLSVVIDAGNGVAGMLAPALFQALGCKVHALYCEVDGHFPNHHPDPSQEENLKDLAIAVREKQADIGIAFDGDGDRLGVVTSLGEVICSDRLLMLFAKALLIKQANAKIIYDVKCTNQLAPLVRAAGGEPIMWKTGHSFIKTKMQELNAALAGEMSGHFFFKDRWFGFDDALYAGARLLEILSQQQEDSATLFAAIPNSVNTPELKVLVTEEEKFLLMQQLIDRANFEDTHELMTIDGLRVNFSEGWGLVRPSNTTPYLILRFEALNETILGKIQLLFREWMLSVKPDLVLPF
jgi:phosphomannomutase/phosphoglucomutase